MARTLERSQALYGEDLLAPAERRVVQLRAGRLARVDAAHPTEELEATAGRARRGLENRRRIPMAHLSKRQSEMQPRRSRS
jgi:Domain of unknown function DUF29